MTELHSSLKPLSACPSPHYSDDGVSYRIFRSLKLHQETDRAAAFTPQANSQARLPQASEMERTRSDLHRPCATSRQQRHTMGRFRKDLSHAGTCQCRYPADVQELPGLRLGRHHDRPGELYIDDDGFARKRQLLVTEEIIACPHCFDSINLSRTDG